MPDNRLAKQIFYSELSVGTRSVGGQRKRFRDSLRGNLKECGLDVGSWEEEACCRETWRGRMALGIVEFERGRRQHHEERRAARHQRRTQPRLQLPANITCPDCGKVCGARIGLISHMRVYR